ncbi:MAG: LemA family protein [Cyanobacteria bacterium]|nr:LemA family protein [Cyanobacteriota bacterium]
MHGNTVLKKNTGLGAAAIILITLVGLAVLAALFGIGQYNGFVSLDTTLQQAASNVDVQLKRRADLIPNLVQTVKGYAKHEKDVFTNIAMARSQLLSARTGENPGKAAAANANFSSALGRLLALAENYPNLKADKQFIQLQDELAGTENRITYARTQYNEIVRNYNTAIRVFPSNIIASITGFQSKQSFEAAEADKIVPKVSFEEKP